MATLSEHKIEIVRTLVESAPDSVVGALQKALSETGGETALAAVRRLVESEAHDRRVRNAILLPIAPLCSGSTGLSTLGFPPRALAGLWRGLRQTAGEQVAEAERALSAYVPGESSSEPFDRLALVGASEVRARQFPDFRRAAEICDAARPGGAELFAACLELSPVVRRAVERLPEWVAHPSDEARAAARLAYKDSVAVADDAGPRFFEMLAAQLPHPWMVLRIISAVMDKPTERYMADSEVAGFAERVIADVDAALEAVAHIDLDGGEAAGRAAARRVERITALATELETCIDLKRDHGWGRKIVGQRRSLAELAEARLQEIERHVAAALPSESARGNRQRRSIPRLSGPPDERAVRRAATLLAFADETRASANYGGFASVRSRVLEKLGEMLDLYLEEVLDQIRTGAAADPEAAHAYLMVVAEFSLLARGEKAADIVRRRAFAALQRDPAAEPPSGGMTHSH
jgi:hypothetical protein